MIKRSIMIEKELFIEKIKKKQNSLLLMLFFCESLKKSKARTSTN